MTNNFTNDDKNFFQNTIVAYLKPMILFVVPDLPEHIFDDFFNNLWDEVYCKVYTEEELHELIKVTKNQLKKKEKLNNMISEYTNKFLLEKGATIH